MVSELDLNINLLLLGWSALQIRLGSLISNRWRWTPIQLDWQPGDIRNCSYAPQPKWIGITAEDRTHGQQVLAVYDLQTKSTEVLLRLDYILHHSLNQSGGKVCYTQPSKLPGSADLYVYEFEKRSSYLLREGAVSQSSTPVWFPDNRHIAYHSADGQIELLDSSNNQRELLVRGQSPAVSLDGEKIAFQQDNQLLLWNKNDRSIQSLTTRRTSRKLQLADDLSWSFDGRYLSFGAVSGLTGKETTFRLLRIADGTFQRVTARYLRGLLIINMVP